MELLSRDSDTICAVSTPPGHGGIAVVRVTGPGSFEITKKIAAFLPSSPESHKIYYGKLCSLDQQNVIDDALVSCFGKGRSYTGQETTEISTHGSPSVTQLLLEELVAAGCRPAERGEFTYRAFMNGNIDLVQAEGVLQLINSQSKRAVLNASRQVRGELSHTFLQMEDIILNVMAHLEADIDFSTEDIEPYDHKVLAGLIEKLEKSVDQLLASFQQGRLLSEGLRVAMLGAPNSGKSSLLNQILKEDHAIVSNTPGTTRDVVTGETALNGVKVKFVDTAGIHQTENPIESIGIQKSKEEAGKADLLLLLIDLEKFKENPSSYQKKADWLSQPVLELIDQVDKDQVVLVANKVDLLNESDIDRLGQSLQTCFSGYSTYKLSALNGQGLEGLQNHLQNFVKVGLVEDSHLITSSRQIEGLRVIKKAINSTKTAIYEQSSPEIVVFEMQEAVLAIHQLVGKEYDDQVMDRVFSGFCIGK